MVCVMGGVGRRVEDRRGRGGRWLAGRLRRRGAVVGGAWRPSPAQQDSDKDWGSWVISSRTALIRARGWWLERRVWQKSAQANGWSQMREDGDAVISFQFGADGARTLPRNPARDSGDFRAEGRPARSDVESWRPGQISCLPRSTNNDISILTNGQSEEIRIFQ